jgi:peptide/nickel transport system ATP-binding protein
MKSDSIIEIRDLRLRFSTPDGVIAAVDGADLDIPAGQTLCLVGESGSGKSVTARAILRIVAQNGEWGGSIRYRDASGRDIDLARLSATGREIRAIRGKEIGIIFQEPMSSLSPVHTVGSQMMEAAELHLGLDRVAARKACIDMLARVGLPRPDIRIDSYPFQLSGGMRQRAMIAMALVTKPRLLIADEPTTALDVTTQAGILDLIRELQAEMGMAVLFITHDLGVVAEIADEVAVMYLGRVVEQAPVRDLFRDPCHPYTAALLASTPHSATVRKGAIQAIRGMIPNPLERPSGCTFGPRCDFFRVGQCDAAVPLLQRIAPARQVRCVLYDQTAGIPQRAAYGA